jgi:hypothetical protein
LRQTAVDSGAHSGARKYEDVEHACNFAKCIALASNSVDIAAHAPPASLCIYQSGLFVIRYGKQSYGRINRQKYTISLSPLLTSFKTSSYSRPAAHWLSKEEQTAECHGLGAATPESEYGSFGLALQLYLNLTLPCQVVEELPSGPHSELSIGPRWPDQEQRHMGHDRCTQQRLQVLSSPFPCGLILRRANVTHQQAG